MSKSYLDMPHFLGGFSTAISHNIWIILLVIIIAVVSVIANRR